MERSWPTSRTTRRPWRPSLMRRRTTRMTRSPRDREDYKELPCSHPFMIWELVRNCLLDNASVLLFCLYGMNLHSHFVSPRLLEFYISFLWDAWLLLCINCFVGWWDASLGVSGDPAVRSWWLGLYRGSERTNPIVDWGLGTCVGRVLWVPMVGMRESLWGFDPSGSERE